MARIASFVPSTRSTYPSRIPVEMGQTALYAKYWRCGWRGRVTPDRARDVFYQETDGSYRRYVAGIDPSPFYYEQT